MKRMLIGSLAVALIAIATAGIYSSAGADDPSTPQRGRPTVLPGWPARGTVHIAGCPVNRTSPVCEVTKPGPFGPMTLRTQLIPVFSAGGNKSLRFAWDTCYSDWRPGYPSYWFEMWTPFSFDYSTVTAMNPTYYDDHSVPLFGWGDHQAYNDWQPGWQYAWGNARADLTYGWPFSVDIGSLHLNALVDAWGNCTGAADFDWF